MANGNWNQSKNDDSDDDVYSYDRDEAADFADRQMGGSRGENDTRTYTSYAYNPVEAISQPSIVDMMMPKSTRSKRPMSPVTTTASPSIGRQLSALERTTSLSSDLSVGAGYEKAPIYEVGPDNKLTMVKPPTYEGATRAQSFYGVEQVNLARDILRATGSPYSESIPADDGYDDPNFIERLLGDKPRGVVLSPERISGTGIEPSVVTDDLGIVETGISVLGSGLSNFMLGDIDLASVRSLVTGQKGDYTGISGGMLSALGAESKVSFDGSSLSRPDDDDSTRVANASRRPFRSFIPMPAIESTRFPSVTPPKAPRPTTMYAAKGGYIPDTESFSKAISERKRGYHMYATGGQVYGVYPTPEAEGSYNVFGGTDTEVRQVFGDAFGYKPESIDFSKKVGEPGFGIDATPSYMKMADGGVAGFVGDAPENVSEGQTVADNVPLDVKEGTFVLNAPAVEFAGSKDVENMLKEGIDILRKRGIDISVGKGKITEEEAVSLLVSKGEVIIPPELAKVIGYDRLEKINNRGLKEVERRQENQGSPIDQQMQQVAYAATGGVQGLPNFSSVEEIDTEADRLLTEMRDTVNNRLKEIDLSTSYQEKVDQRAKITSEALSQYHDQIRNLKENSDPYAFQMFQDRNADKNAALQNALDFGDYSTEREQKLADKASMSINVPFGGEDDKLLGGGDDVRNTGLVGFAFPYLEDGSKVGYVAGKKTENTDPSSTARHETAHLEFKGRGKQPLMPLDIGGTTFAVNEEQILRLIDLDRTKTEGLEGEYERAMKKLTQSPRGSIRPSFASSLLRFNTKITREEIEENLPQIIEQIQKVQSF